VFDTLGKIWGIITHLDVWIEVGAVDVLNYFFSGISSFMATLAAALPPLPSNIAFPGGDWVSLLNWGYPLGAFVAIWATLITTWLLFLPIRTALRWVKLV
jgi:hypothetical protein